MLHCKIRLIQKTLKNKTQYSEINNNKFTDSENKALLSKLVI